MVATHLWRSSQPQPWTRLFPTSTCLWNLLFSSMDSFKYQFLSLLLHSFLAFTLLLCHPLCLQYLSRTHGWVSECRQMCSSHESALLQQQVGAACLRIARSWHWFRSEWCMHLKLVPTAIKEMAVSVVGLYAFVSQCFFEGARGVKFRHSSVYQQWCEQILSLTGCFNLVMFLYWPMISLLYYLASLT